MKSIIPVILLLFIVTVPSLSQSDFKVIKVNGTILLKTKGISLETGTVFSEKEDLVFRSEDATAAVINSQKGRVVITSKNHDLSAARTNNMPSMYNISSRGGSIINKNDLSTYFSGKFVVLEKLGIKVDDSAYPMDNDHFFFLRYNYKGEEINKKLAFSHDTVLIDKTTLFTVDGKPIPSADNTAIKLFYRKGNESVFLSEFNLIFPDMKQLSSETEIIINEMKGKPSGDIIRETEAYISEFYGKVSHESLSGWMEARFGIK
jgi:hypothetical protein